MKRKVKKRYTIEFKLSKYKDESGFIYTIESDKPEENVLSDATEYFSKSFKTPVKIKKFESEEVSE